MVTQSNNFGDVALATEEFEKEPVAPKFQCPICEGLLANAVMVPCCSVHYCDKCVRKHLVKADFKCPGCSTQISPDSLEPNKELRSEIESYKRQRLKELIAARKGHKSNEKEDIGDVKREARTIPTDDPNKIVTSDPARGTVTEILNLGYKYEEVSATKPSGKCFVFSSTNLTFFRSLRVPG